MFARRKKIESLYIIVVLVILFFIVHRFIFPCFSFINSISSVFMYPVLIVQRTVTTPIKHFFKRKKDYNELEQLLRAVQKECQIIEAENVQLRAALAYYKEIEELVDFNRRYKKDQSIIAHIILRMMNHETHIIFIDKGSRHGVQKDMVAIYQNGLVGRVTDVYPLYSKLILVTDKSCKVAAHCLQSGTSGIHVGTNKSDATALQRVSHLSSVREGDLVVSSGEGLVFPQGFSLGRVKTITPNDLYIDIMVEPLIDLRTINYCSIMKKSEYDALSSNC